jgi:two-component system nitrogen regulation response regulator GlnG
LNHYFSEAARELDAPTKSVDSDAMAILRRYDWPGNVRQVVNTARRLTVTAPGSVITADDIPTELGGQGPANAGVQDWTHCLAAWAEAQLGGGETALLETAMPEFEKTLIQAAMAKTNGHRQEAAKLLGWGRNTLARKMKALQMD